MKANILLLTGLVLFVLTACKKEAPSPEPEPVCTYNETEEACQMDHFYYYRNAKNQLYDQLLPDYLLIGFQPGTSDADLNNFLDQQGIFEPTNTIGILDEQHGRHRVVIRKFQESKSCVELACLRNQLIEHDLVILVNPVYQSGLWFGGKYYDFMSLTDEFLVKVYDPNQLADLNQVVAQTGAQILSQNQFMDDWFVISTGPNNPRSTLELANYFHETGKFAVAEPSFAHYLD